jgi:hypothetical protein
MLTLQVPEGVKTLQLSNAIVWMKDGILFSRPTTGEYVQLDRQEMDKEFHQLKNFIGSGKVCMLAETHPKAESPHKEDRDYISERLNDVIKALAIITPNALSRMVTNLFFVFKPPLFPTRMFINVSDAEKWLHACMANETRTSSNG